MRVLWAPWRMSYIKRAAEMSVCLFCRAATTNNEEENLVLLRTNHSLAMLNAYPYNTAHVMIAPKRHVARIELLHDHEVMDLFNLAKEVIKAIDEEYRPDGYNIGVNVGRVAGAGVEAHIHVHIVPRWLGDTNFMPTIAETKVMPEDLKTTLARLKSRLKPR
ncbi:MAG: HIT domain-containing protein [Sulfolobales archaeon]